VTSPRTTGPADVAPQPAGTVELAIGRLLFAGTVFGVALLLVGVVLMALANIDPARSVSPQFDVARIAPDLLAARPEGFLWAGIAVLIATPVARVVGELVAFAVRRDRTMALVALAILGIIGLSVVLAIGTEG
jgi:uncharacterized membrane protein